MLNIFAFVFNQSNLILPTFLGLRTCSQHYETVVGNVFGINNYEWKKNDHVDFGIGLDIEGSHTQLRNLLIRCACA